MALQQVAQHGCRHHYGHQDPLHSGSFTGGVGFRDVDPTSKAPTKISRVPIHRWGVTVSRSRTLPRTTAITYLTAVTGRTKLRSARLSSAIRVSNARISAAIPIATNGFNI